MYRIETLTSSGWEKVNDDEFSTRAEAQADLDEFIILQHQAYARGDMGTEYDPVEWRVVDCDEVRNDD